MIDTSPEIEDLLICRFQAISPQERLEKAGNMFATGRRFAEMAVKKQNPAIDGIDLKIAAFRWMYQNEIPEAELDKIAERMREAG